MNQEKNETMTRRKITLVPIERCRWGKNPEKDEIGTKKDKTRIQRKLINTLRFLNFLKKGETDQKYEETDLKFSETDQKYEETDQF